MDSTVKRCRFAALVLVLGAGLFWAACSPADANVYPSSLSQTTGAIDPALNETVTLSFVLNEPADQGVTVEVVDSGNTVVRTINLGPLAAGLHTVQWDGKNDASLAVPSGAYSFRVTAADDGHSEWTLISTDSVANNFELPRGLAVNTNPDSPYYGRVYVSNSRTNSSLDGRVMADALYILRADLAEVAGPVTGGVDWSIDSGGAVGPFRLEVGPDDRVYITDWSDPHSGLWVADPNINEAITVFDNSNRDAAGLNATHGSLSDVVITGLGANRKIYTADEDYFIGASDAQAGSVWRYDIGNIQTWTGPPSDIIYDNAIHGWNVNFFNSLALSTDGTFWYSQNRSAGTDFASLIQVDTNGDIIWDSLTQLGSPDPLRGIQAIDFDPVNDWLAVATYTTGNIHIFDDDTKTILATFPFGATTNTDTAFDAVGNLYVANRSAERVRIWSPPSGQNSSTTSSAVALGPVAVTPMDLTLDKAPGQADPASSSPINFQAVFSAPVTGFTSADVIVSGSAGATTAVVTGGPSTYNIAVSGMSSNGEVRITIPAAAAADGSGNINPAATASVQYVVPDSIPLVKMKADGQSANLLGRAVTVVFDDRFFIEEDDRSAGIMVVPDAMPAGLDPGDRVDVAGTVATNSEGERYVSGSVTVAAGVNLLDPVQVVNKSVGGADWEFETGSGKGQRGATGGVGLNNVGLYVEVWGQVTGVDFTAPQHIYIDDGSNLTNDTPIGTVANAVPGLKIETNDFAAEGNYVTVRGVVRLDMTDGGDFIPVVHAAPGGMTVEQ